MKCLCLTLCVPLIALAYPKQIGEPDCKSLISHSGFAEFVLPSEGGTHTLPVKVDPSAKWSVRNSAYVEWIEVLNGASGTGPGSMRIRLQANTSKYCRVGVLTISGLTRVYGLPITILQRGNESARAENPAQTPPPSVINLTPFSTTYPQNSSTREYRKVPNRR